jgi:hypothetical protein
MNLNLVTSKLWLRIALIIAGFAANLTAAKAADIDWKLYGISTYNGIQDLCFFDLNGVAQTSDQHVKVWIKCLHQQELEGVDISKDYGGKILNNAAQKIISGYMPPMALVEDVSKDLAVQIATMEETADLARLKPSARILYELDCSKLMLRELSTEILGENAHLGNEWKYIAPETNAARLQKILCEKSATR